MAGTIILKVFLWYIVIMCIIVPVIAGVWGLFSKPDDDDENPDE